ncbi:MAG: XamI family restriction endonuclease [Jatrophihabitantaceae bacterium]
MPLLDFPRWSDDEFRTDAVIATANFVTGRAASNPDFAALHAGIITSVESFFTASNYLLDLTPGVLNENEAYRWYLGYCVMPPISADNLRTIAGDRLGRRLIPDQLALNVIAAVKAVIDSHRFPWLAAGRTPTPDERERAIAVTAALLASQRIMTLQRNQPAMAQQQAVSKALTAGGMRERLPRPTRIHAVDQLDRGEFCGETLVGNGAAKADRPARLLDGRLLAIGCKVTNSGINSRKRLLKDIASDGAAWDRDFGASCIPAAVITGVIDLATLREAQDQRHTFIIWDHNLDVLTQFVRNAVP